MPLPSPFRPMGYRSLVALAGGLLILLGAAQPAPAEEPGAAQGRVLTGTAAYGGWESDKPGVTRHLTPADLPPPYATKPASNGPHSVGRPDNAWPKVPAGFKIEPYAIGLTGPRLLRTAPNGDVFVAESEDGSIRVLRPPKQPGAPATVFAYIRGLDTPFGLAFYPPGPNPRYLYVGTTTAVLRFPYRNGDTEAHGKPDTVVSGLPEGGHSTRDVVFSRDGRQMYVSVGSRSNDAEDGMADEKGRADILVFNPDGSGRHVLATGMRNPVGLAVSPVTGDLWTAVNERDGLGDNLPPDYVTRVVKGAFYGWPWFYIGNHQDPRHKGQKAALRDDVTVPDVLLQPHSAPLQLAFYTGKQFPPDYRNNIFVALHGSWNRSQRTGYKVVRVLLHDGKPTGAYQDFVTGFVSPGGDVWGRPVGVTVAPDGALLVSDDAGGEIWRISYKGPR